MSRPLIGASLVLLVVLSGLAGYALGGGPPAAAPGPPPATDGASAPPASPEGQIWTCSMHPRVRLPAPGNCPICEMPLIPASNTDARTDDGAVSLRLSDRAIAMASVETEPVTRRTLTHELRVVGRIEYNEASLATITPRVAGYAERLFVNVTGVNIRQGDHLAEVYSPELLVAQHELLILLQGGADAALVDVAKKRVRLLGLTDEQVAALVERRETADHVTLYSPISGTVIEKDIVENAAFEAGHALFKIANLDTVWVTVEVYEFDLPWVRYGQHVRLQAEALPGREFEGLVTFVQPVLDDASRTIRVPVHVENRDHALMPGMFVTAVLEAALSSDGRAAPTGAEGRYTCRMHPQVLQDGDGECPLCDMPLQQIPPLPASGDAKGGEVTVYACPMGCEGDKVYPEPGRCPVCNMRLKPHVHAAQPAGVLALPGSAILDSGTRQLVYVERGHGTYEQREVVLGPRAGPYYAVLSGVHEGERVVTRGNFLIDSQLQVMGSPSLLYPGGLEAKAAQGGPHPSSEAPSPSTPGVTGGSPPASPGAHQH